MALGTLAIVAQLAPLLLKAGQSIYQKHLARSLESDFPRPQYQVPRATVEAERIARVQAARTQLPGQGRIEEGMDLRTANLISQMQQSAANPAQIIQNLPKLMGQREAQQRDLDVRGLQYQEQGRTRLAGALKDRALEEQRQFQLNELAPYQSAMQSAAASRGAGNLNRYDALRTASQMYAMDPSLFGGQKPRGKTLASDIPGIERQQPDVFGQEGRDLSAHRPLPGIRPQTQAADIPPIEPRQFGGFGSTGQFGGYQPPQGAAQQGQAPSEFDVNQLYMQQLLGR